MWVAGKLCDPLLTRAIPGHQETSSYTNRLPLPLPFTGWVVGMTNKIPVPLSPKGSFLEQVKGKLGNLGALVVVKKHIKHRKM